MIVPKKKFHKKIDQNLVTLCNVWIRFKKKKKADQVLTI